MEGSIRSITLDEAANRFLAGLPPEERTTSLPEIRRFVRWFGLERTLDGLAGIEVANYAERLSLSDTDYSRKLDMVRAFLAYAKKEKWSKTNLAVHIKTKKGRTVAKPMSRTSSRQPVPMTQQGYGELESELANLKSKRPKAIEEMRRAAADKDFRENVPLQAAREERGVLEGRIIELEETLKSATIVDIEGNSTPKVGIGKSVIICDLASGEEVHYTLVSPKEVNLAKSRISVASPIGRAIVGKNQGEIVEVEAPVGRLRYQVKKVE